jgi:hypothetical protein
MNLLTETDKTMLGSYLLWLEAHGYLVPEYLHNRSGRSGAKSFTPAFVLQKLSK